MENWADHRTEDAGGCGTSEVSLVPGKISGIECYSFNLTNNCLPYYSTEYSAFTKGEEPATASVRHHFML